ncbi:unnamed protein product [Medioppia subpectinata]|uniref:Uncharacterized protein n=1 Tax=Medioppia subpectinata TaxID=1979941 RepID=A0A7R9KJP5_9ACAR|nr:unnamed protein product [Medioppia subpectinata]CAG2104939.1 unnamed protein product [Medioppia subpectinata]
MHEQKKYAKLGFYIDTCDSGMMFIVFINLYLPGSYFADFWLSNDETNNLEKETLDQQYDDLVAKTVKVQHAQHYGDLSMGKLHVAEFLGHKSEDVLLERDNTYVQNNETVSKWDVELSLVQKRINAATETNEKLGVYGKYATCPDDVPIKSPCSYFDSPKSCDILCSGNENFDIKATLEDLSHRLPIDKKQFRRLELSNKVIEQLPANTFSGLQFSQIYINGAINLKRIHNEAFNGTASTITYVYIKAPVTETATNDSVLFGAINALKGLQTLYLVGTGVKTLPTRMLSGLTNLRSVTMHNNPLKLIYPNAFDNLPSLRAVEFYNSPIDYVSEHAFTVGCNTSAQHLAIYFRPQLIDSFDSRAFESIGCQTNIHLMSGSMKYLNRNVFEVFLNDNTLNAVFDTDIDCADSRNQWIKDKYPREWQHLDCK